jgi:hypothetical protein
LHPLIVIEPQVSICTFQGNAHVRHKLFDPNIIILNIYLIFTDTGAASFKQRIPSNYKDFGEKTLLGSGSTGEVHKLDDKTVVKRIPVTTKPLNRKVAAKEIEVMGRM